MKGLSFKNFLPQFVETLGNVFKAYHFIREHKIWKGLRKQRLIWMSMLVVTAVIGYKMIHDLYLGAQNAFFSEESTTAIASLSSFGGSMKETFGSLQSGSYKYLILICLELLIFHLIANANAILSGEKKEEFSPNIFMKAQIRMFVVSILVVTFEAIADSLLGVAVGLVGLDFLERPLVFFIKCFFLGYVIIDNYYELKGLKIKQAYKRTTANAVGVSVAAGLTLFPIMVIPVIGPFVGTVLVSVAVAMSMNKWDQNIELKPATVVNEV